MPTMHDMAYQSKFLQISRSPPPMDTSKSGNQHLHRQRRLWYAAPLISAAWLILLAISGTTAPPFPINTSTSPPAADFLAISGTAAPLSSFNTTSSAPAANPCAGRYVYMHDLPHRFNVDMLRHCRKLSLWTNMCPSVANSGLGPLVDGGDVLPGHGWYATYQFSLDVIFHSRMRRYLCLTANASAADAVYVPFYAGFDVGRHLWGAYNVSVRDKMGVEVVRWLTARPEWAAMGGRDHFMAIGRITYDLRRPTEEESGWGSKFLRLPAAKNMSALIIESSPWQPYNDFAIPYPTYFHPSSDAEVFAWQERIRATRRPWLFSFAGAPRPTQPNSIRTLLIDQCRSSTKCKLLDCVSSNCSSPPIIMQAFTASVFCLQPPGDSFTRRSAFDAMVAGCVPVFFHPASAYLQYKWHLPKDYSTYSVFIPEADVRRGNVSIEEVLSRFGDGEVGRMREEVIRTMPRLIYSHPRARLTTVRDAFDVALEGVIERVRRLRREVRGEVASPDHQAEEENGWKYGGGEVEQEGSQFLSSEPNS